MSEPRDALTAAKVRGVAVLRLVWLAVVWPVAVLWYGLPCLWQDWPVAIRREWLTLWRGKTGPYKGVVW